MNSWQHKRNACNKHSRINSFFAVADIIACATADASRFPLLIVAAVLLNFSWHYLIVHVCNMSFCVILSLNETIFTFFIQTAALCAAWQSFHASSHFHIAFNSFCAAQLEWIFHQNLLASLRIFCEMEFEKKNAESILYAACKWDDEMFLCFSVLPASLPCSYRICTVYKLTGFWLWFSLVLTIHKTSICTKSEARWIANQQIWIWNLQNPARVHIFRR